MNNNIVNRLRTVDLGDDAIEACRDAANRIEYLSKIVEGRQATVHKLHKEISRLHTIGDALVNALEDNRTATAVVLVNQWWKGRE